MRPSARRAVAFAFAAAACALTLPATTLAGSSPGEIEASKTKDVAYLKSLQLESGSFAGFGGEWVLTSLAADGIAAADVRLNGKSTDARAYYRSLIGDTATWPGTSEPPVQDFETAALAAYAAGVDPARVSSTQNLIAQVIARYQPSSPGYYGEPNEFDATVFGLLALADAKTRAGAQRVPQPLLEQSIATVRRNQHDDGGWTFTKAEGSKEALEAPGEAELTGAAMAALCTAGVPASDAAVAKARSYLVSDLKAESKGSGAFQTPFGPNTDSNAWAVEGLNACGIDAQGSEFTTSKGNTPIAFLISQQLADGGFRYEGSETEPDFYSSQDALRALAGAGFTSLPPKPHHAKTWLYQKQFTKGTSAQLALIVNDGSTLQPCAVTIAPAGAETTLAAVLEAAEEDAAPAGCVQHFTPASGHGAITSIDGQPSPPQAKWKVSIDGSVEKQAKRATKLEIGDTIYLRLS